MAKTKRPARQIGPTRAALAEQIEQAFDSVPYPGDDRIAPDDPMDLETGEIAAAFKGQHWKTVSADILGRYSDSLFYFTPEAFRFFLPAFLLAELTKGPREKASVWAHQIGPTLEWNLLPPRRNRADMQRFRSRMDPLTSDQKAAVRAFLHWKHKWSANRDFDPSKTRPLGNTERALRDYWEEAR